MLLYGTSKNSNESADHHGSKYLHRFDPTSGLDNLADSNDLLDSNYHSKTIFSTFSKWYRNLQYPFMSTKYDIGEFCAPEPKNRKHCNYCRFYCCSSCP